MAAVQPGRNSLRGRSGGGACRSRRTASGGTRFTGAFTRTIEPITLIASDNGGEGRGSRYPRPRGSSGRLAGSRYPNRDERRTETRVARSGLSTAGRWHLATRPCKAASVGGRLDAPDRTHGFGRRSSTGNGPPPARTQPGHAAAERSFAVSASWSDEPCSWSHRRQRGAPGIRAVSNSWNRRPCPNTRR